MTLQDIRHAVPTAPRILTLPGWQGSGPTHWQSRWEALYGDERVEQHDWTWPLRGDWMMRLDETIADIVAAVSTAPAAPTPGTTDEAGDAGQAPPQPIVLVAHSLGCQLVAAWAAHSKLTARVQAALLVAPPDVERADAPPQLHSFRPVVRQRLPFRALAVISSDDPFCSPERALGMAADWGAGSFAIGPQGHLNADSRLGDWPAGRALLAGLISAP